MRASSLSAAGLLSLALACGGGAASKEPPAKPPTGSAPDSPTDRCLAIAGAKHEKKAGEPGKVSAKHVLVKYAGAKNAAPSITRSRADACLRAAEAHGKLEQGASFDDVVKTYSEEAGAASRDGSLGAIQRTDVVPAFADAAFELKPGEVSQVVETPFGFHVILRTE